MKIKEVCQKTGLTDRAIRFYIENELFFPNYTENYLGRKTYDFSINDVVILKQIATLREYNFSIENIKELLLPEGDVQLILEEHIEKLKKSSQDDINKLESLINSLNDSPWTPEELCNSLNNSSVKPIAIKENNDDQNTIKTKKRNELIISIFFIALMIIILFVAGIVCQNGSINITILSYFFATEGLLGFYVIKTAFKHYKSDLIFFIYLLVVLIVYLIGTFGKYIM